MSEIIKKSRTGELTEKIAAENFAKNLPLGYNHLLGYCVGGKNLVASKIEYNIVIAPKR